MKASEWSQRAREWNWEWEMEKEREAGELKE